MVDAITEPYLREAFTLVSQAREELRKLLRDESGDQGATLPRVTVALLTALDCIQVVDLSREDGSHEN
jgi:hypothetical protein